MHRPLREYSLNFVNGYIDKFKALKNKQLKLIIQVRTIYYSAFTIKYRI